MSYQDLTFMDYRNDYFEKADHMLVDVRSNMEYKQGHVPHAVNIPLNELPNRLNELDDSNPIVVICASGSRSQNGAEIIKKSGVQHVYNLQGGTMIWMMNGLPLEQ